MASQSALAQTAVERIGQLYGIKRAIVELTLNLEQATAYRQQHAKPLLDALHAWLLAQRQVLTDGTASAKAFDYALRRWPALVRYADDARLPMDNNRIENQIRPWALGRNKVKCIFMRSQYRGTTCRHCGSRSGTVVATSHNQSACKNCIKALGGRYRAGLTSGDFSRASARSFIARSASTYMCVVDGLSWPSHSAISHGSAPD